MLPWFFLLGLVTSTALTVQLEAHESQCYHILTTKAESTVGFYFAVQSGGSFDIDFTVKNPSQEILKQGFKQSQGDYSFDKLPPGEYEFCFSNKMSTFADKVVDFEIDLKEDDFKAQLPKLDKVSGVNGMSEPVDGMVLSVSGIEHKLSGMLRTLQYYKTRNNRNEYTVKSTEDRIFWFSILEMILMCALAGFQIAVVHFFFNKGRKHMV